MTINATDQQKEAGSTEYIRDALARAKYFEELPAPVLQELADAGQSRFFKAGETVVTKTQYDGTELYCIVDGWARLTNICSVTNALRVDELSAGDVFGLEYALGDFEESSFKAGLTAKTDLAIVIIDSHHLRDLVKRKPLVARALLSCFAHRLVKFDAGHEILRAEPQKRIFRSLFDLMERDDTQVPSRWRITQMPKHRALGEIAGTSELDAAEAIARLISEGIVKRDYPGLLVIKYNEFRSLSF